MWKITFNIILLQAIQDLLKRILQPAPTERDTTVLKQK